MRNLLFIPMAILMLISCENTQKKEQQEADPLKQSLMLHASFDKSTKADYAKGDPKLYNAPSRKSVSDSSVSAIEYSDVKLVANAGKEGGALQFNDKSSAMIYYKSKNNLNYDSNNWQGTISFWLKLDPNQDLKPGFCDPIQITDVAYNDASVWVDFTRDSIRQFRLGVIGDLAVWNPDTIPPNDNPAYMDRLVWVKNPPFSREQWTHVAITHEKLGSNNGTATLYLNGKLQGTIENLPDPFTWEVEKSNIYLGINYIGLFDELMIFDKPLSAEQINRLSNIEELKKVLYSSAED
ncbi:MAG: LamG domain-containing protein [Cyclobacteriaceae bacterium]